MSLTLYFCSPHYSPQRLKTNTKVQCRLDEEFMSLSIPDGRKTFEVNGDRLTPGVSIANSGVGLSSLKISAYFLRLIYSNSLVSKTEISAAYRHISVKILEQFPDVMEQISSQLTKQRDRFRISIKSHVENPLATIQGFNRQFQIAKTEQEAVDRGYHKEPGNTMFNIVNAYTRGLSFRVYRLNRVLNWRKRAEIYWPCANEVNVWGGVNAAPDISIDYFSFYLVR